MGMDGMVDDRDDVRSVTMTMGRVTGGRAGAGQVMGYGYGDGL